MIKFHTFFWFYFRFHFIIIIQIRSWISSRQNIRKDLNSSDKSIKPRTERINCLNVYCFSSLIAFKILSHFISHFRFRLKLIQMSLDLFSSSAILFSFLTMLTENMVDNFTIFMIAKIFLCLIVFDSPAHIHFHRIKFIKWEFYWQLTSVSFRFDVFLFFFCFCVYVFWEKWAKQW